MTAEELRVLGEERRLIFINLANGVPVDGVMAAFHRSEKEVNDVFAFVAAKIRSYRFERGMPMVPCGSISQARTERARLLDTLRSVNLATDPRFSKIEDVAIDQPEGGRPSDAEIRLFETRMRSKERNYGG